MSYPQQPAVTARLQDLTNKALDARIAKRLRQLAGAWSQTRRDLRAAVVQAYRTAAPSGRWDLASYRGTGAEARLKAEVKTILLRYRSATTVAIRSALKGLRWESALRHAWILDQVTPHKHRVILPQLAGVREAGVLKVVSDVAWSDRWAHWVDSYAEALPNNISMGAMNGGDMADAVDEVDATTINTPRSTLSNALERIFNFEAQGSIAAGEDDVVGLNPRLVMTEVWKTRGSRNVCDECDENEGLTVEEASGDIPLHPRCNCFWIMVPRSYADLLASSDEDDNELATILQARGITPMSLVIRGEDGKIAAKAVVDFSQWVSGQFGVIGEL